MNCFTHVVQTNWKSKKNNVKLKQMFRSFDFDVIILLDMEL